MTDDGDPTAIRALVVHADDVVAALEANGRRDAGTVLRVTPPFPTPDGTADELRASEEAYTPERHRERHEARVESWRATVRGRIVTEATVDTPSGPHAVAVKTLG